MKLLTKFKTWLAGPPEKLFESDVVYLKIVRKTQDGKLVAITLSGEDAERWGWLMSNCSKLRLATDGKKQFAELDWKREYVTST
jgi:hypothetical protein